LGYTTPDALIASRKQKTPGGKVRQNPRTT